MQSAVPSSVPASVPSAVNTVPVLDKPQLGPYQPMLGSSIVPEVGRTPTEGTTPGNPRIGYTGSTGRPPGSGSAGAPSVPLEGSFWRRGPIDPHYQNEYDPQNPYGKVNNPPTRGMFTWVKDYVNGIFLGAQNVDTTGFQTREAQQRTSVMRITPPAHGDGYSPQTYLPKQMPQAPNWNTRQYVTGTDPYGSGVLNSDQFGAGQVAGGIGGSSYTPSVGQNPPTTAVQPGTTSAMPTWG